MTTFRRYASWLMFVVAAVLATTAGAQDYPNKPVRIIIAFSAGGPNDAVMRPLAQRLQELLGQPFVIDYRPGANGVIGADLVAKSPPDGYTLLAVSSSLPVNAATHVKQPYDLARDFAGVSSVAVGFLVFVVNPTVPVRTIKELVALARARPGMLSYASSGTGGSLHLAVELLALVAGVKMLHIPHKGASPALTDVIAGHVDSMFVAAPVAMPQARNGRVRVIAVASAARSSRLPDVPTFVESGFPKVVVDAHYGLIAPVATPRDAITKLNAAIGKALTSAEIRKLYDAQDLEAASGTPEAYGEFIREEIVKWRGVVASAKLQLQ
jgi:tripartite-type tricarboxylate transporter receptor subunit TctC